MGRTPFSLGQPRQAPGPRAQNPSGTCGDLTCAFRAVARADAPQLNSLPVGTGARGQPGPHIPARSAARPTEREPATHAGPPARAHAHLIYRLPALMLLKC